MNGVLIVRVREAAVGRGWKCEIAIWQQSRVTEIPAKREVTDREHRDSCSHPVLGRNSSPFGIDLGNQ